MVSRNCGRVRKKSPLLLPLSTLWAQHICLFVVSLCAFSAAFELPTPPELSAFAHFQRLPQRFFDTHIFTLAHVVLILLRTRFRPTDANLVSLSCSFHFYLSYFSACLRRAIFIHFIISFDVLFHTFNVLNIKSFIINIFLDCEIIFIFPDIAHKLFL